eukprot:COSAG01_NODE_19719_length_993_cov_5.620879_1_plen_48_part_00
MNEEERWQVESNRPSEQAWLVIGVSSMHNMKFLLLALKSGSADLLIE